MKQIYFLITLASLLTFSACQPKKSPVNKEAATPKTTYTASAASLADGTVKDMDAALFQKHIVNLEKGGKEYLSPVPAVIDCYAVWCGPCKKQAPILEELAKEYKGKVAFWRVDVEKEPAFTQALNVSAMPTLFFVNQKGGNSLVGLHSKEDVKKEIEKMLNN